MHDDIIQHHLLLRRWLSLEFFIFSTLQKTYQLKSKNICLSSQKWIFNVLKIASNLINICELPWVKCWSWSSCLFKLIKGNENTSGIRANTIKLSFWFTVYFKICLALTTKSVFLMFFFSFVRIPLRLWSIPFKYFSLPTRFIQYLLYISYICYICYSLVNMRHNIEEPTK